MRSLLQEQGKPAQEQSTGGLQRRKSLRASQGSQSLELAKGGAQAAFVEKINSSLQ